MKPYHLVFAVAGWTFACSAGTESAVDARAPAGSSPSETRAASAPMSNEERAAFDECRPTLEGRCRAAHPAGGADEDACREKLWERYAAIKTASARVEYLAGLGCRTR